MGESSGCRGERCGFNPSASSPILFNFNSAALSTQSKQQLDQIAAALNAPSLKPYSFRVEGHTDAFGGEAYNERLSLERAEAVSIISSRKGASIVVG